MRPVWLSDEQRQLRDMLHRLVEEGEPTRDQLAELGIWGATLPEEAGGLGFGLTEATIVAEALGRARSRLPYVETAILAGGLVATLGSEAQRAAWLPGIADGSLKIAIAFAEGLRLDPLSPQTIADGFRLTGSKAPVAEAEDADLILINAREGDGLSLFLIEASALPRSASYQMVDGRAAATIELAGIRVDAGARLGPAGGADEALAEALLRAAVVQAAEQGGIMAHLINATIDYLKQRKQFGVPLSSFQALQHKVADMVLGYEQAVSLVAKAGLHATDGRWDARMRDIALSAATIATSRARFVGHEAIQLHGGMGVTEELSIGPAVQRLYALETRLCMMQTMAAKHAVAVYGSAG